MSLNGRLEDMNLLEILQIIAFSTKTGSLRVDAPLASGAILFREGMIMCAVSTATSPLVRQLAGQPLDRSRALLYLDQVKLTMHELVASREGSFSFRALARAPTEWEGMDVSFFLDTEGVDPQQVMLELARELDEARRDSSSLLETPSEVRDDVLGVGREIDEDANRSEAAGSDKRRLREHDVTVVLVDDERQVLGVLEETLNDAGCTVHLATGPAQALEQLERRPPSGNWFVITDVGMPSSTGDSFEGGFELVEKLDAAEDAVPVLLMAEALSPESRERAKKLGIRKVAFKPALTKLDASEYVADLRAFAAVVVRELAELVELSRAEANRALLPAADQDVMFDFLKTMTDQLTHPSGDIARKILRVSAKHTERGLVFLVRSSRARGLAGVRMGYPTKTVTDETREISFDLQEHRPFAEVVYSRAPLYLSHESDPIAALVEPDRAEAYALLPMLHNHEVLAILYCDNPNSGAPLPTLAGLELFLAQAGMALENASLHRKLRSLASQFSIDNQGPLTQEISRMIRGGS